ncbi:hypothetical protein FHX37_0556 [Haloactinospora alba]|uniref:Uncharacterized protein n=1 Tax=Haloactinospora alba TaxID=405555 RepID=A0A543NFU5_9ACTN|nr:DUF6114 domain-containing protein [Haloactinospora alba]TQN30674.1 hypothetical protein FHX37_0556 [Haloactinospora alba]
MTRNGIGARRRASARSGFRNWRRTRPFWGGLLVALGGVVILLAPLAPLPLIITQGIAGVSGYLVGLLLIAIGVLSWIQPPQRMFFGIVAILLSLASFVTSNFGGFVLGMLLGLVGGAMLFAWMPRREPRGGRATDGDAGPGAGEETPGTEEIPSTGPAEDEGATSLHPDDADTANQREEKQQPDNDSQAGGKHSGVGGLAHASVALPLALTLTLPAATAPTDLWDDWFGSGDDGSSESTPSPTPSESESAEPAPDDSPTDGGDGDTDSGDGSEEGDSDGDSGDGSEDSGDGDGEGPDGSDDSSEEDGDGEANPEECQFERGESSQAESEEELLNALEDCQAAKENDESPDVESEESEDDRFIAGTARTGLSADSLTMKGATFDGVVEYPTTDGPKRYLKMSMDEADFEGARQWFDHSDTTAALDIPAMTMSGDVEMHVTRMEARILGIKLTFTPDFPPPLLLPYMTVTDLEVDQPLADANAINIDGLNEHAAV